METKNDLSQSEWIEQLENELWDRNYREPISEKMRTEFSKLYNSGKCVNDSATELLTK